MYNMKKIIFLYLLTSSILFAQKKYLFDYAFAVKQSYTINKIDEISFNSIFLVNSQDNSYHLYALDGKDSLNFSMHFIDHNGVSFNSQMSKVNFYKAETISNSCNEVFRYLNPYRRNINQEKSKQYNFINYSDTIINDTSYYHYALKSNRKLKYQKRKKIYSIHYIVEKSDSNFLPFANFSLIYEIWKISKTIPNGIPKIIYYTDFKGEKTGKMEIKKIKVDKYATIPEECDYSNPKIWEGK